MNLAQRRNQSGFQFLLFGLFAIFAVCICSVANAADPLASWNEGPAKQALLEFVAATTDKNGKDYVKPAERIAVFDNDGTLDKALDRADAMGWVIVDMKKDWKKVFPRK